MFVPIFVVIVVHRGLTITLNTACVIIGTRNTLLCMLENVIDDEHFLVSIIVAEAVNSLSDNNRNKKMFIINYVL